MIFVTCLGGPYNGQRREPPLNMDPIALFQSLVEHGWDWQIDYALATPEEAFLWGRADLIIRAIRALRDGRTVTFMDKIFRGFLMEVAGALEDVIVDECRMITLRTDGPEGVVIDAHWPECEQ